jgi:antirestriction protein
MQIYIACLASYNNGTLHGKWIDATSDVDEMQEDVDTLLRSSKYPNVMVECPACGGVCRVGACSTCKGSGVCRLGTCSTCKSSGEVPSAEEFAIHDFDGIPNLGEYCGLQAVADYVEFVEAHDSFEADEIKAVLDDCCGDLDLARERLEDGYCGTFARFQDFADEYVDDCILPDVENETAQRYFDYDSFARDLEIDMHTIDTPVGVMVFHA